ALSPLEIDLVGILDRVRTAQSAPDVDASARRAPVVLQQLRARQRTMRSDHRHLRDAVHDEQLTLRNHAGRIELGLREQNIGAELGGPAATLADGGLAGIEPLKYLVGVAAVRRHEPQASDEDASAGGRDWLRHL